MLILVLVGIAIVFIVMSAIKTSIYNDLVAKRNKVKNSWAHVEVQLQRRFDLVPNLMETVKGFVAHEKMLVKNVTTSIEKYQKAQNIQEKIEANELLTQLLQSLYALSDESPQLKSNANFLQLQTALTEIEEDLSYSRQFYNDAVTIYNNSIMQSPNNKIAYKHGFTEETLFVANTNNNATPKIKFKMHDHAQCPVCGAEVVDTDENCKYCGCSLT